MRFVQAEHGFAVVTQMESDIETRQRHALDDFLQVIEFGFLGFEKLAPGGRIEEQVAHFYRGAHGMRRWLHARCHVATFGFNLSRLDRRRGCARSVSGALPS